MSEETLIKPEPITVDWLDLRRAIEQEPPELDFVLPGLKSGTVGALVGTGSTGKTMLALQSAVTVAGGPDMLGFAEMDADWHRTAGRAVFLTAEDPSDVLNKRFHAIGQRLNPAQREAIFDNLSVAPLFGRGADMMTPDWRRFIEGATRDARLVIVDTLRRFHRLDENDGGRMAEVLGFFEQVCREQSTTVLFLHHTSKAGGRDSGDAQQASRGSSVLTDNARFQANLVGMTPEQAKQFGVGENFCPHCVRLAFSKLNYSAPLQDRWFRRGTDGVLEPMKMVAVSNSSKKKGGRSNDEGDW